MNRNQQNKDSVLIYSDQIASLLELDSMRDLKTILEMIRLYGINGEEVDCPKHLRPVWVLFKGTIDRNAQAYSEYVESRKKAGQLGYAKMMRNKAEAEQNSTETGEARHNPAQPGTSGQKPAQPGIPLCVRDSDSDINISLPNGSESNARTRTKCESVCTLTDYPKTVADVLAICNAIKSPMSEKQAQAYLDQRTVADWHQGLGGSGRKISVNAIPADIRRWIDRDKAEVSRSNAMTTEREAKRNATAGSFGRYVPQN